ncbi:MAG: hypothetical protein MZV63_23835 [Marinilabiliales bacterium]|nr:hypothetical protein [Marinilabiliales bacterium]
MALIGAGLGGAGGQPGLEALRRRPAPGGRARGGRRRRDCRHVVPALRHHPRDGLRRRLDAAGGRGGADGRPGRANARRRRPDVWVVYPGLHGPERRMGVRGVDRHRPHRDATSSCTPPAARRRPGRGSARPRV